MPLIAGCTRQLLLLLPLLLMQALMMQQEALLTRDVKRSPLTVVVALPEVLRTDWGSGAGAGAGPSIVGAAHSSTSSSIVADDGAAAADLGFEWPMLAGVDVLGWHLPAGAVVAEVVQRTDSCGGLTVVQRVDLPPDAASAAPGGLRVDLSALGHMLECPFGLRVTWQALGSISSA